MPFGVALAASLGARVIKIEDLVGDPMRTLMAIPEGGGHKTMDGKESIAVDLRTPEGQQIIYKIVSKADVFVNGFRPGVVERLKVDYETLKGINPRLVYLHAAGYGASGPYSHRPMYAQTAAASVGGVYRNVGQWLDPRVARGRSVQGLKELAPRLSSVADGDANAALAVGTALLLAIFNQKRTNQGQYGVTTMIGGNAYAYSDDFNTFQGKPPIPRVDPEKYGLHALYRLYQAKTGWVFLACPAQKEWERFCTAARRDDLLHDRRFASPGARRKHEEELASILAITFQEKGAAEWEQTLSPEGVGCVKVFEGGVSEFTCTDPVLRETGLVVEMDHPIFGRTLRHGLPVAFSETPGRLATGCKVGQHTDALLTELGYTADQVRALKDKKVVASSS
jgi:crotonobetainyl-CoA:carnitine CoA-transferase CaiB-like acyl-CoA transferase